MITKQAQIQDFFAGGGGGSTTAGLGLSDGGSRVDKHQIKVHSVHRIFRAIGGQQPQMGSQAV